MGIEDSLASLAVLARDAADQAQRQDAEARAQHLARRYRCVLLRETPGDLPQAQFLCILSAVLGRFARDMAETGDVLELADALGGLVRRHAAEAA